MTNAGKYRHRITIYRTETVADADGFQHEETKPVLEAHAEVKTFKGATLIRNGTDFEKATTAFFIRRPTTAIDRKCFVSYRGKTYTIEYLNDNSDTEWELQCKEVTH